MAIVKILVFVAFVIFAIFTITEGLQFFTKQGTEAKRVYTAQTIEEKVKIPKGMEHDYELILKGQTEYDIKKRLKEDSGNLGLNTAQTNSKPVAKKKENPFKTKTNNFYIENGILFADVYIHNSLDIDANGEITIECKTFNNSKDVVNKHTWKGQAQIKSKKTILLKNIRFGESTMLLSDVECSVLSLLQN